MTSCSIPNDVDTLCKRELRGGSVQNILPVSGGQHELYRVSLGNEDLALKIIHQGNEALDRELLARKHFSAILPVPRILLAGRIRADSVYLFSEWANGVSLRDALLEGLAFSEEFAFEQAGSLLGKLHDFSSQDIPRFRGVFPNAPVSELAFGMPGFSERLLKAMDGSRYRFQAPFLQDFVKAIEFAAPACIAFAEDFVVCHGDFQPKNLIYSKGGQLRAVIDWELCRIGSRLGDIAHLMRYVQSNDVESCFCKGYAATYHLPCGWRTAMWCYDLARVGLGMSHTGVSDAPDFALWIEFMENCIEALLTGHNNGLRCMYDRLLRHIWISDETRC